MKIVHICPTMTDGFSYQENYLTKYHRRLGLDVTVITSLWVYGTKGEMEKSDVRNYINSDGVKILRLELKNRKPYDYKFKTFANLKETLESENPDILFIHGCQWIYIKEIVQYVKNKKIIVYVDNHADYSNSATNWRSKYILHKIIWRHYAQIIRPYVTKFYGVLPARVDILTELYGIPRDKCELLVMGADDELVQEGNNPECIKSIRKKYRIETDDFLIVTGGKIDVAKQQTLLLMKAVRKLNMKNVKLIVFGSVDRQLKDRFDDLCGDQVFYAGWLTAFETYKYIGAADLVIYPGRHSVLWEQTVAQGKPMVVKHWEGTTHVDIGGNVRYLYHDSEEEIQNLLIDIIDADVYSKMLEAANGDEKNKFLYSNIARQSISDVLNLPDNLAEN